MLAMHRYAAIAAALLLMLVASACASEPLDVAPNVDLTQFQGKWYEIAHLPRTTQTDCHGTMAFYSRAADGSLQFVNQCNVGSSNGPLNTVSMSATVPDSTVPAKLALDVGGYSGDYWILEVGPNYDYAVVGHPSRLYLWILSRAPTLDPATTQAIVARAQNNHFDTSQLLYTDQPTNGERVASPGPVGAIPPAVSTGCTVAAPGRETSGSEWILGLFAAVAVWLARRRTVPTATYALPQVGRPPKAHGRVPPMG